MEGAIWHVLMTSADRGLRSTHGEPSLVDRTLVYCRGISFMSTNIRLIFVTTHRRDVQFVPDNSRDGTLEER